MIKKLNAFSALARVMLSGAVVALAMAAPVVVLAQDPLWSWQTLDGFDDWSAGGDANGAILPAATKPGMFIISGDTEYTFVFDYCENCAFDLNLTLNSGSCTLDKVSIGFFGGQSVTADELPLLNDPPEMWIESGFTVQNNCLNADWRVTDFSIYSVPTSSTNLTGNFDAANVFEVAGDVLTLFGPVIAIIAGIGLGFVLYAYLLRYLRSR